MWERTNKEDYVHHLGHGRKKSEPRRQRGQLSKRFERVLTNCGYVWSLADPDLQKQGGQIFHEIFERPFLGISRKISAFPKIPHLSSKISDDLFSGGGRQTPLPISMGGHGRICPPLDPPLRLVVDRNNLRCDVVIELCYRILNVTSVTTKNILRAIHSACLGEFLLNIYLDWVCGKVHSFDQWYV